MTKGNPMICECGAMTTVLIENEDGTVTPKCEACYLDVKFNNEALKKEIKKMKIWTCKIGEVDESELFNGADAPMREAVEEAYKKLTGKDSDFIFSGWGSELDISEREVFERDKYLRMGEVSENERSRPVAEKE